MQLVRPFQRSVGSTAVSLSPPSSPSFIPDMQLYLLGTHEQGHARAGQSTIGLPGIGCAGPSSRRRCSVDANGGQRLANPS